ncbi:MAG: DUF2285 domain-containing protein [Rhizobiales bacterium]|nr:DUF2285 domain-containing protein [Hyphomicrobiales bacterium]
MGSESATPFWRADINPNILRCIVKDSEYDQQAFEIDLKNINCKHQFVETNDGKYHLLFTRRSLNLQLVFDHALDWHNPFKILVYIYSLQNYQQQKSSISCLERLIYGRIVRSSLNNKLSRYFASPKILFAYDLKIYGYSNRQIAQELYGEDRISDCWDGISDSFKTKTKRIISKSCKLIDAGFKSFF